MVSKEESIFLVLMIIMVLGILSTPIIHLINIPEPMEDRKWGYYTDWCDQFYTQTSETLSEYSKTITWSKAYCSI